MSIEEKRYLTVTALTKYIKYKFDHDIHLESVLLEGEISNFKRHSRGNFYFTLKDENAQISAIMFLPAAMRVNFVPKDGLKVYVKGSISVYEPSGTYSINVISMEEKGLGALYIAYEKLKNELALKGYFDPNHKKMIPIFPKAIGIISSPTGAAIKDCINTIKRRFPLVKIYIYPTLVQGDEAKFSIVKNIELANKQSFVDTLIVGRGGGSIEDLWAFNEEIVAMAIYNSNLPIISAVGHDRDTTIADFVADKIAATPTAAAELATPLLDNLKDNLKDMTDRIIINFKNYLKQIETKLLHLDQRLENQSPTHKLKDIWQRKLNFDRLLALNIDFLLKQKEHQLTILNNKLLALSPDLRLKEMLRRLNEYNVALRRNLTIIFEEKRHSLILIENALKAHNPLALLIMLKGRLNENEKLLKVNFTAYLNCSLQKLNVLIASLKALNPLAIMEKGYSIVYKNKNIVKSINELGNNDLITIRFKDGVKNAKIVEE